MRLRVTVSVKQFTLHLVPMVDSTTKGPTLGVALDDLKIIASAIRDQNPDGSASYTAMQQTLPKLNLHLLTYIRFLENHGYAEYDRVNDSITISASTHEALHNPDVWREDVKSSLGAHLKLDDDDGIDFDVDNILEGFGEISEPNPEPLELDQDENTGPDLAIPNVDFSTEPFEPSTPPATNTMTQDPLRERRFSTGNQKAVSPESATPASSGLYERLEELGSGGMGTVFKAKQVKLDRVVALKEVKEIFDVFAGVQRSDIIARFTEIVQTQSRLIHPNIIQTIDLDTDGRFPFVVMQLAPNGNLRRLIDVDGRPPLQVALKYFLQILHALSSAHDHDVTHGGIKPENVVLDSAGNALITDFGISQVVELDGSRANQVYVGVGTVAYMSPEQFRDPNASSVKSDIYSLGIMLYEMLTGKVPGRRSPMPSSFYPDIPRKLDDIFDRMSMDDQSDRYDNIDEILADLYSSKDVMKILDKRGGFVFLRDPIQYGANGLKVELAPLEDGEEEGEDSDLSESSADSESSELSESSAGEDSEADEEEAEEGAEGEEEGDVLDKLDKYGKLFEEEDED